MGKGTIKPRERLGSYVNVRMTSVMKRDLDELAKKNNVTVSEVIRSIIEQYLREESDAPSTRS